MSERLYKLARKYAAALNPKQTKLFLAGLTEFPFKPRMILVFKVIFKIPLVKFSKKDQAAIKEGRYLK